jgi:hypothetical protein
VEDEFGKGDDFLARFKAFGWYLDDLVLTPVNQLKKAQRRAKCLEAQKSLANRISVYQPEAIVSLLIFIRPFVDAAAINAGSNAPRYAVPFPGMGQQTLPNRYEVYRPKTSKVDQPSLNNCHTSSLPALRPNERDQYHRPLQVARRFSYARASRFELRALAMGVPFLRWHTLTRLQKRGAASSPGLVRPQAGLLLSA